VPPHRAGAGGDRYGRSSSLRLPALRPPPALPGGGRIRRRELSGAGAGGLKNRIGGGGADLVEKSAHFVAGVAVTPTLGGGDASFQRGARLRQAVQRDEELSSLMVAGGVVGVLLPQPPELLQRLVVVAGAQVLHRETVAGKSVPRVLAHKIQQQLAPIYRHSGLPFFDTMGVRTLLLWLALFSCRPKSLRNGLGTPVRACRLGTPGREPARRPPITAR